MESSDEEDDVEDADTGGAAAKTKHDLMQKSEVSKQSLRHAGVRGFDSRP